MGDCEKIILQAPNRKKIGEILILDHIHILRTIDLNEEKILLSDVKINGLSYNSTVFWKYIDIGKNNYLHSTLV